MSKPGKNNPNYKHGRYAKDYIHQCINCGTAIDARSKYCYKCRSMLNNPFKGEKHSASSLRRISAASKAKFTKEYIERIRLKHSGNKKRDINGYVLIKDYNHPNRNSHNDVLEHIWIMASILGRPVGKKEVIHHINFVRNDNTPSNLWLYPNQGAHSRCSKSIFKLVKELLDKKIIQFTNGEYQMYSKDAKETMAVLCEEVL